MRFKAEVKVTLKRGVLDPQGATVEGALGSMGYAGINGVRVGKLVELWVEAPDAAAARTQVEEISRRLLANPVLEQFSAHLTPAGAAPPGQPATPAQSGTAPAAPQEVER